MTKKNERNEGDGRRSMGAKRNGRQQRRKASLIKRTRQVSGIVVSLERGGESFSHMVYYPMEMLWLDGGGENESYISLLTVGISAEEELSLKSE